MSNLKPCPFCRGEAENTRTSQFYHVVCTRCGIRTELQESRIAATAAWNNRPGETAAVVKAMEAVLTECSEYKPIGHPWEGVVDITGIKAIIRRHIAAAEERTNELP